MSITFTWAINPKGLITKTNNGNADTVVQVCYKIGATDGVHTVLQYKVAQLVLGDGGTFIPFADLTENQVLAWVKASLRPNQEDEFKSLLIQELEHKAKPPTPIVAKAAPWNTCVQG